MELPSGDDGAAALALVNTIRHDSSGGVTDDLDTDDLAWTWLRAQPWWPDFDHTGAEIPESVRRVRMAARALFGMTVKPAPPSRADAGLLIPERKALAMLNDATAGLKMAVLHEVRAERVVSVRASVTSDVDDLVPGLLSLWVLDFLAGERAGDLRSCQAPRCVRYFLTDHGRQRWCKQSCGNRARVAKHASAAAERARVLGVPTPDET